MNACPVCGSTDVYEERSYTIRGQRVVMRLANCLHGAEDKKGATPSLTPPPVNPLPRSC